MAHLVLPMFSSFDKFKEEPSVGNMVKVVLDTPAEDPVNPKKIESLKNNNRGVKLKNLLPSTKLSMPSNFFEEEKSEQESNKIQVADLLYYQKIWERIDEKLFYPGIFVVNELYGVVRFKLHLKKDGTLASHYFKIDAPNKHLRVFVELVVKSALSDPLHQNHWVAAERSLDVEFDFDMFHTLGAEDRRLGGVSVEELYFYRKAFNPSAHPIKKAIPILGPPMIDLVATYNWLSGRGKRLKREQKIGLQKLLAENEKALKSL